MLVNVRNLMLAGVVSFAAVACTQEKKEGFRIEGEVAGVQSGTMYLKCFRNGAFVDVDSAAVENGTFVFEGVSSEPLAYALTSVKENRRPSVFFLGNEDVRVSMDESQKKLSLTGSAVNDLYAQNETLAHMDNYDIDSLVSKHPDSPVSAYLFVRNFASRMNLGEVKGIRAKFAAALEGSEYVKQTDELIARMEKLEVGAVAPDFTLPDAEGNPVSLSSLRGKYVLIDFWAGWCPDCRKENPNIVSAYRKFKDKNFTVLGVSLDRKKEQWLKAIEKDGLDWTHVCDFKDWDSDVARLYVIKWIPKNFLIDPNGVILASGLEGQALHDKLQEVLK